MDSLFSNIESQVSRLSLGSFSSGVTDSIYSVPCYSESEASCPGYTLPTDELPSYKPTLEYYGVCLVETEFLTPYTMNSRKKPEPMLVELNSTQLVFYKLNCDRNLKGLLAALIKYNNTDDNKVKEKQNLRFLDRYHHLIGDNKMLFEPVEDSVKFVQIVHKYECQEYKRLTLNNSQVGVAPDISSGSNQDLITLTKYKNCLRLRIELYQLLLHFWSFSGMVNWYRNLNIGKDLSNFGTISKSKSLPSYEMFRHLQNLSNDEEESSANEVVISGFKFYTDNRYSMREVGFIKSCLLVLNSFNTWKKLVISNVGNEPQNNNMYLNSRRLNEMVKSKGPNSLACREFSIEQEGLVSVASG